MAHWPGADNTMLKTDLMRICKNTYYSDSQLDKGGAETSEGDAEKNPAQVPNIPES